MTTYESAREFGKRGIVSENYVRRLIAMGECPGIRVGSHFKINSNALIEKLERESREMVLKGVASHD